MKTYKQLMLEDIKNNRLDHSPKKHGWTGQLSKCHFANWWDCNFWCGNPKLNPKMKISICRVTPSYIDTPDWGKCKKLRRKLK